MKHYPFAPGVIDASKRRPHAWRRLGRAGFLAVVVMGGLAVMAAALLLMGLFHIELFEGARLL